MTLGADTALKSTAGDITFDTTLDGGYRLTVNSAGTTTFGGSVGGSEALGVLLIEASGTTALSGSAVTTIGSQRYSNAVTLGADTALKSTAGDITFESDVKSDVMSDVNYSLTVFDSGTTTFSGPVGGSSAGEELLSLFIKSVGGATINGGFVITKGPQTYNDIVTLGANTILTGANITLGSVVKSDVTYGLNYRLTVSDFGKTTFSGPVGGSSSGEKLLSLFIKSIGGTTIHCGTVTTTGPQRYYNTVTLGANTTLKGYGITFDATVQSDGTDNYSLTVWDPGVTIFNGSIGGTTSGTELSSLETYGIDPILNGGSVTTTGPQTYHDNVTLGANTTLTGSGITFDSTVQSDVRSDTNLSLTVVDSGSTVFGGAVGGDGTVTGEKLSSLTISSVGDATLNGIQATGPISVVTSTGNLIVDGNISTLDTSAKAIQLNAGQDLAAGTATGGNIIINSGTISVGTGGIATLYTGSVLNSTGLTNLVGSGSGRFRYNSNQSVTNYNTLLAPLTTGLNAIYRESPSVEVALANESIQSITGVQNNDPVTNLAGLIALGYSNPTVTVLTDNTTSVYASTRVDDVLLNSPPVIVDDLITVVSAHVDDVATTADEVESNLPGTTHVDDLPTLDVGTTPPASGVISGTGPSTHVAVPPLVLAGINTFNGGNPVTAAVPNMHSEGISPNVQGDVIKNEADKYADLVQKVLMTGGAVLILGSGALLLGKKYTVSHAAFGKHANVYAHLDHGYQHLNSDVLPKESEQKREVSVRIHLDMGIQEVKVEAGSLVNSD